MKFDLSNFQNVTLLDWTRLFVDVVREGIRTPDFGDLDIWTPLHVRSGTFRPQIRHKERLLCVPGFL